MLKMWLKRDFYSHPLVISERCVSLLPKPAASGDRHQRRACALFWEVGGFVIIATLDVLGTRIGSSNPISHIFQQSPGGKKRIKIWNRICTWVMDRKVSFSSLSVTSPTRSQMFLCTHCLLQTRLILSTLKTYHNCTNQNMLHLANEWWNTYHIILSAVVCLSRFTSAKPSYILCLYHYHRLCFDTAGPMTPFNIQVEFCGEGRTKQTGRKDRIHYSGPSAACSCYCFAHSISQPVK